ncbi:secretin N-terminal domain-containing protein [Bosea sp. RAC05]|uniref:secretin N-terminal domain-containing protein n=1 Tax=Bosea sp. RAC05 TaxID=1842539 RepID=UPI00083CA984|nr:secretin N-terminal domain-containing protein [Bosea sp. RAC05]AOG03300.1 bacterial type II and III secretion system family protein [Bosea sp. RAC05]
MRRPFNSSLALALCVSTMLSACASTETIVQTNHARENAERLAAVAPQPMAPRDVSAVKTTDQVYVGATAKLKENGDPLPSKFESGSFTIAKSRLVSFQEVAAAITEQTGIPVAVASVSPRQAGGQAASIPGGAAANLGGNPLSAATAAIAGAGVQGGQIGPIGSLAALEGPTGDLGITGRMKLAYSGRLSSFLDLVGSNFNVAWEHKGGRIVFSRYMTKVFEVPGLPTSTKLAFSMSSGSQISGASQAGGGQSATGGTDQSAKTESSFEVWKDISENLQAMVAGDGAVQVATGQGTVTVVATPTTMRRVSDYLRNVNQILARQVAMSVKVYSVTLRDGDTYGSDINLLFQNAGKYGLRFATTGSLPAPVTAIGSVPAPAVGQTQGVGWAILDPSLNTQGSGIVQALSTKGDVSVVTSASVTTINGQPVPFQVSNTRGYLAQVSVTQSTGSGSGPTAALTPGSVTTGFNLHLVPKIQRDGSVLLQYAMNISELVGSNNGFEVASSGGNTIQLPNVNQRNFIQQAILPNNATLVLAGFEQVRSTSTQSGTGHAALWPFGGVSSKQLAREILVITITPTILDVGSAANLSTTAPLPVR